MSSLRFILACLTILVAASAVLTKESRPRKSAIVQNSFEKLFHSFVVEHQKPYSGSLREYHHRSAIFRNNLAKIARLNRQESGTAKYGVNLFADMSEAEFKRQRLGYRAISSVLEETLDKAKLNFKKLWEELLREENKTEEELLRSLPASFDWREYNGTVTDVKDQGQCGSCWSFATTGSIEGQYAIKRNKSVSLSEQELIDCDKLDQGCDGGLPQYAYAQIIKLGGLETEQKYPYEGEFSGRCQITKEVEKFSIDGYVSLPSKDEDKMRIWLVKRGPLSMGINADQLMHYKGGVLHPSNFECSSEADDLDHATLIVGYGTETTDDKKELPYWIIKNSWTSKWGENGYYRIFRGNNTCGLAIEPSSAVLR